MDEQRLQQAREALDKIRATPTEGKRDIRQALEQIRAGAVPQTSTQKSDTQIADERSAQEYGAFFPAKTGESPVTAGLKAIGNVPSSMYNLGKGLVSAVAHPVETVSTIGRAVHGGLENAVQGIAKKTLGTEFSDPSQNQRVANQFGKAIYNRYGTLENAQRSATNDPFGVGADVLSIARAGAGLIDKATGSAETIARNTAIQNARNFPQTGVNVMPQVGDGAMVNALNSGISAVGKPLAGVIKNVANAPMRAIGEQLGMQTGSGYGSIKEGFNAASTGQDARQAFMEGLRGNTTPEELVNQAHDALQTIKTTRNMEYRKMLEKLSKDPKNYDVSPIIKEVDKQLNNFGIKKLDDGTLNFDQSKLRFNTAAQNDITQIYETMRNFGLKPGDRSAIGIDSLKQAFYELDKPSSSVRAFTTAVANKTRSILENSPGYSKGMKQYAQISEDINDITKGLSLGDNAMVETTFKKLTSALRQNNDFRRIFVEELDKATGGQLVPKIAGQQLSPWLAQGLVGRAQSLGGLGGIALLGADAVLPILGTVFATSPRLVGEFINALGLGAQGTKAVMDILNKFATTENVAGASVINTVEQKQDY